MTDETQAEGAGATSRLSVEVIAAHTTTHLPPARAVITTPALVALMEQCIAQAERAAAEDDGWRSVSADIRHRAGLRRGETAHVAVQRAGGSNGSADWGVRVTADDGGVVAEGTIARRRGQEG